MLLKVRKYFWLLLLTANAGFAQNVKKLHKNITSHIEFLADDKLEGRRAGSNGERLAYEYISTAFTKAGLKAKADNGAYLQAFPIYDGKQVNSSSHLIIDGNDLKLWKEYFPLSFSAKGSAEGITAAALQETGGIWLVDIKEKLEENKNNPHFDLMNTLATMATDAAKKGSTALIFYNTSKADDITFEPKLKIENSPIPVLYLTKDAKKAYLKSPTASLDIKLKVDISDKSRTGHNVVGYIDNGAPTTVVVGAHYDHLGYGEDHNSLFTGNEAMIHNGADDNASGTAAVIELAGLLKKSKYKKNNYLLVCFSGEELGLLGSKFLVDHLPEGIGSINCMINMDMIGRLNDSTHGLTIGGYGTSPVWGELVSLKNNFFNIKIDSSGTGPSDHTSFYRKDIPVLFFFTGLHTDYHKPSDDADKINYTGEVEVVKYIYNLIGSINNKGKLPFTKTREAAMTAKSSFKVTLGIMPDYTFSGAGVRVDGVSEGRPAQKAGIKAGDVLIQLGDHKFSDVPSYMEALSKFNKGDHTKVQLKRGNETMEFNIEL